MATDNNGLGSATEFIKAGLRQAGVGSSGASTASNYFGKPPTEAEAMIKAGLKAAGLPPIRSGLLDNTDAVAKRIGDRLMTESEARIAEQRPHEKPTEPTRTAESYIREGLGKARHRQEAAAQAKEADKPKVRRTW